LQEYPVLAARSAPNDVSAGPDGNVWFVDAGAQKIGRVMLTSSHAVRSTR
jgi:streptogramin lyase